MIILNCFKNIVNKILIFAKINQSKISNLYKNKKNKNLVKKRYVSETNTKKVAILL